MVAFFVFILLLLLLFFITHDVKNRLFTTFITITQHKSLSIALLSLLLYPGTVAHELSHLIIAAITFTPVKGMKLVPEVTSEHQIRGGSVTIAKVDIFRRTLIGIAPLFVGLTFLWVVTYYLLPPLPFFRMIHDTSYVIQIIPSPLIQTIVALYLVFSVSATMFSSRKDLEALVVFVPVMMVCGVIVSIVGFQISWLARLVEKMGGVFEIVNVVLIVPILIHIFILMLLFLLKRLTRIP